MNLRLFFLIHNEKTYKRYYYQPTNSQYPNRRYPLKQFENAVIRWLQAAYMPFNPKYNTQQFPGVRKNKIRILWENLVWNLKYKEVCKYYYLWGLDLKGHSPKDYVAYTEFRVLRNILNIRQRENKPTKYTFNYLALTRDKFCFGQYANSLGFPVPQTIALISNGKISWLNAAGKFTVIYELLDKNITAFCKECTGEGGTGAFTLDVNDGSVFINNEKSSIEELVKRVGKATYILQQRVANHPQIAEIYPNSVNTLRVVTVYKDDAVHLFDARLRTGANGSVVDNACFGGVVIGINKDGTLMDWGYQEPGKSKRSRLIVEGYHPDTGKHFSGLKVPFWNEIIEMAKSFHGYYYGIPSIGWDVAITPNGPVFLECGEDWEMQGTQVFFGGRRKEFYKLHGDALNIKLRKY